MRENFRFCFVGAALLSSYYFSSSAPAIAHESLSAISDTTAKASQSKFSELSPTDEALIHAMPLKNKVGQLFMVGFMGDNLDRGLLKTIESIKPGGIIVFGRNISSAYQIANLNLAAQKISLEKSKLPLLIAVDQEGGNVVRIKTSFPLPSALALGETGDSSLVERAGYATGSLLRTLGFNMNLAPVLDVSDPSQGSFIGTRTFGSEPNIVSRLGAHFAKGLQAAEILPTAKHFPGHGGLREDSHLLTPAREASYESLKAHDLIPFYGLIKNLKEPWAVMLAHVAYPQLDNSGLPATFSKVLVEDLLRKQMSFDGLVLTDDIEMAGAFAIKEPPERAVRAIEAGADMIMVAWNKKLQTSLVDGITRAISSGRLSEERINQSVRRILIAKRSFAAISLKPPSHKQLVQAVQNREIEEIARETMLAKLNKPLNKDEFQFREFANGKPLIVFSPSPKFYTSFSSALGSLIDRKSSVRSRFYRLQKDASFNIDRVMRSNPNAVGVFYLAGEQSARVLNSVSEDVARRMLVVTVEPEGKIKKPARFRHIADVYFRHPDLGRFIAQHYFVGESLSRHPSSKEGSD